MEVIYGVGFVGSPDTILFCLFRISRCADESKHQASFPSASPIDRVVLARSRPLLLSPYPTLVVAPLHSFHICTNGFSVTNFFVEIISPTHIVGMFIYPHFILLCSDAPMTPHETYYPPGWFFSFNHSA